MDYRKLPQVHQFCEQKRFVELGLSNCFLHQEKFSTSLGKRQQDSQAN